MLLAVGGAKFRLISLFGSDVPFGDQWYGELATVYVPWLEGRMGWRELFVSHNEHRIFWTRLLDLGLVQANGQWDPRLQLTVSALLALGSVAILWRHFTARLSPLPAALAGGLAVVFFSSEALWENTLSGFQSQFYFLLLFSLVHVLETGTARPYSAAWWTGQAAGLASVFSMAPGLLSACTVVAVTSWRHWRCREPVRGDFTSLGWNSVLVLIGLWTLPPGAASGSAPAAFAPLEAVRHLLDVFSWPVMNWHFGLLVWMPALVFLGRGVVVPHRSHGPAWLAPLTVLGLLFCAAVTFSRGGVPASRYGELFTLGLLANFACLLTWPATGRGLQLKTMACTLWGFALVHALWREEENAYLLTFPQEMALRQQSGVAIRHYLATGDQRLLRASPDFGDYQLGLLDRFRADGGPRAMLPLSLQPPKVLHATAADGFHPAAAPALPGLPADFPVWSGLDQGGQTGRWESSVITAQLPIIVFYVAGEIRPPLTSLHLVTGDGQRVPPMQATTVAKEKWVRLNFRNPGQSFQVVAEKTAPGAAFAFSAPVEYGRLSWFNSKLLRLHAVFRPAGWILLSGAMLVALAGWLRAPEKREA